MSFNLRNTQLIPQVGQRGAIVVASDANAYSRTTFIPPSTSVTMCGFVFFTTDRNTFSSPLTLDSASNQYMYLETDSDGVSIKAWRANSGGLEQTNFFTLTTGNWYFMALTYNGVTLSMDIGLLTANALTRETVGSTRAVTLTNFRIGRSNVANEFWNGRIAGVKVWNRALSPTELNWERRQIAPANFVGLNSFYPLFNSPSARIDFSQKCSPLTAGTATFGDGPPLNIPWQLFRSQKIGSYRRMVQTTTWPGYYSSRGMWF